LIFPIPVVIKLSLTVMAYCRVLSNTRRSAKISAMI
jgi:hypothetical protein